MFLFLEEKIKIVTLIIILFSPERLRSFHKGSANLTEKIFLKRIENKSCFRKCKKKNSTFIWFLTSAATDSISRHLVSVEQNPQLYISSTNAPKLIQNKTFPHLNPSISNKKKTLQRRAKSDIYKKIFKLQAKFD